MDDLLISTLYEQINEGNKGDGDFKAQAHQAVVDKLRVEMGISATVNLVSNGIKVWKKHYAMIIDIRTYTKFKWDEEKKVLVIPIEDLAEWTAYCEEVLHASSYKNKRIQYWVCLPPIELLVMVQNSLKSQQLQ